MSDVFDIVRELASTRPDSFNGQKRMEMMDLAIQSLELSTLERKTLAHRKDLVCWSKFGYRRLAKLLCVAILAEKEKPQLRSNLCSRMCNLILQSGDAKIMKIVYHHSSKFPVETLQTIANENLAAWALLPSCDWGLFVKLTLSDRIAASKDVEVAKCRISTMPLESWESIVGPAVVNKLKSKPESVIDLVNGLTRYLSPTIVAQSNIIQNDLLPLLMKQVKSAKEKLRERASSSLENLGNTGVEASFKRIDGSHSALSAIVRAALDTKPLTQVGQRQALYITLSNIGGSILSKKVTTDSSVVSEVLAGIRTSLAKESTNSAEARQQGLEALVSWMIIGKRNGGGIGYDETLTFFRNPVAMKNGPESQLLLGTLVYKLHPDMLESIVLDLWKDDEFVQGLDDLIQAANKKFASASNIPQVEGLLAVYLSLVKANGSSKPKLSTIVEKAVTAGVSSVAKTSFLYGTPTVKAIATNSLVATVFPRFVSLVVKLTSSMGTLKSSFESSSALVRAIATCITHPSGAGTQVPSVQILATVRTILDYQPIGDSLVEALMSNGIQLSLESQEFRDSLIANRKARQEALSPATKGKGSPNGAHAGMDVNAVRRVAHMLCSRLNSFKSLGMALVLMHFGTSRRASGKQRVALITKTSGSLKAYLPSRRKNLDDIVCTVAQVIVENACKVLSSDDGSTLISEALYQASQSLIFSLGGLASGFATAEEDLNDDKMLPRAFAYRLCTARLPPLLAEQVGSVISQVESLSMFDIDVYRSPAGTLFEADITGKDEDEERCSRERRSEDEEWEFQTKKELAKKKQAEGPVAVLSAQEKKIVLDQDKERCHVDKILRAFKRTILSIDAVAKSDIEVGSACLPTLSHGILAAAVSTCPAMLGMPDLKVLSFRTLTTLASCVYEIDENYASTMATALVMCYRKAENHPPVLSRPDQTTRMSTSALASPCEPAAQTIFEMDELHEEMSGASFSFLFPVVRASLKGPRTTPGCEGALRVLERHTLLLAGEERDPIVVSMRGDMIAAVLELLKHDRSQAFVDPNPYDTLVACFQSDVVSDFAAPPFSTAELSALLDDRGALGTRNCRVASMRAIAEISTSHPRIVKANPLIENRVWLNCFAKDEIIRNSARKAWGLMNGLSDIEEISDSHLPPPSPLYAISLLPLLDHADREIASTAASAFAHGMAAHPNSVNKNIEKLCSLYIDSSPQPGYSDTPTLGNQSLVSVPFPKTAAAPPKKLLGIPGSLKKKIVKKSALQVAGIGQPKKVKKKSAAVTAELLKPKQERTLDQATLESQFKTGPPKPPPEKDTNEKVAARLGVLSAFSALSSCTVHMDTASLKLVAEFLLAFGIADANDHVKNASRDCLRDLVASYGGSDIAITFLLPLLDKVLRDGVADDDALGTLSKEKIPQGSDASNRRKEGAVVVLGSVAVHLEGPENSTKIDMTVDMLMESLITPSEDVQASVADCLAKLMKKGNTQKRVGEILEKMTRKCLNGDSSSLRRGGAYGLAAAVKGSGIATLKKYGVVDKLEEACASGNSASKEGSLFAIELLCTKLGLLFEPYVIVLLPSLLKSFGDTSDHVRKAASHTAGLIMSKLSAHGVKLVMPAVLTAFDDNAWRTKQASIRMLGSMCHLAPKQLAQALPKVVPKVIEAFADTHPKVKNSAQEALDEITTVIKNPEISALSSVLLKALTDPADNTSPALEGLIGTEFLHAIDAPSLAMIVPIVHRGLRDRAATTKRYGALITGNICTMINDPRDFVPYLPTLVPDLQSILLDPIPDVRSIAAKALGSLTRGLGEEALPDLRPWLIDRLCSEEISSAERSGAAQGLTEVLIASGNETVERVVLEDILTLKNHPSAVTREGVLWVLTFLPPALGQGFTSMLDDCLPALINGLSDEHEEVRDIGIRAGRVIIRTHGRVHYNKILPILENGMGDTDHRIRLSSLMLVGDLLSMIGGTSVLRTDGNTQDDIRKAEKAQAQLTLTLGMELRNKVLSEIYLARSDSAVSVRQAAIQVWKTVVSVTARTLRQILPVLVARVVSDLASGDVGKTEMAGKCLGDIVGKLGESVMPEIVPVLRDSLYNGDNLTRRGVCVGLSEVIGSATKEQIIRYLDIIVKVVQDALCDGDGDVRQMAAASFQSLHALVGNRAMDEVVPAIMVALESSDGDIHRLQRAINGLTGILSFRSKDLLPYIIPRLIQQPITVNHAKAIAGIASVTGDTIVLHTKTIIPALIGDLAKPKQMSEDREAAIRETMRSFCASAHESGINGLLGTIASKCNSDKADMRRESCWAMELIITERRDFGDFYGEVPIIIRECINRLNDENSEVLKANQRALSALSTHVPAEVLVDHVEYMRNLIATMVSDARRRKGGVGDGEFFLPGFNMPKGLEPLLPIYQRGVLYGVPSIREASAAGLGEVIKLTANKFLAGPLIIKMTGPLLRVVGDRNPANVKIAILQTLGLILVKGGPALRAFVPQFQTTFVKALSDPSRLVRIEAISALALLMPLSTRVDPLIKELVSGSGRKVAAMSDSVGGVAIQTATLEALSVVLREGGNKAKTADSIPSALVAGKELLEHPDEDVREAAAKVVAASCNILGIDSAKDVLRGYVIEAELDTSSEVRHGTACAIRRLLSVDISAQLDDDLLSDLLHLCLACIKDGSSSVKDAFCVTIGAVVGRHSNPTKALRRIESELLAVMESTKERLETHQALARGLCLALHIADADDNVAFLGVKLLNACLKLAMSGAQRVQFAFNDVLYIALNVSEGDDYLNRYSSQAMFEDSKQMKSLYSKVLMKMKRVTILDD